MPDDHASRTPDPVELILEDSLDQTVDVRRDVALKLAAGLAVFGLTGFVPGFVFGGSIGLSAPQRGAATFLAAAAVCYVAIELWRSARLSIERWEERWKGAYSTFRVALVEEIPALKERVTVALQEDARRVRDERLREYEREEEALVRKSEQARDDLARLAELQSRAADAAVSADPDELRRRMDGLAETIDACDERLALLEHERGSVDQFAGLSALSRFEKFADSEIRRLRASFGIGDAPSEAAPTELVFAAPEAERLRHLLGKDARFGALRARYEARRWIRPRVPVLLSTGLLGASLSFFSFSPWAVLGSQESPLSVAQVLDREAPAWRAALGPYLERRPESSELPIVSISEPGFQALALPVFEKDSAEIENTDAVRALIAPVLDDVARCATEGARPIVHLVGFADRGCLNDSCDDASRRRNVDLANERARAVRSLIARDDLPIDLPVREWTVPEHGVMLREAKLSGFLPGGRYDGSKERINRRVELRLMEPGGACKARDIVHLVENARRPR